MTDKEILALMEAWSKAEAALKAEQLNAIMNQGHREN
jgi:hypothetical protein